jgi:predicted amidohydrolase YtcJ
MPGFIDNHALSCRPRGISVRPLRWMLMHMEGVTPPLLERMKKLNMIVGVHPREMTTGGLLHRVHGDKAFAMPPLKEIQDSGIVRDFTVPN